MNNCHQKQHICLFDQQFIQKHQSEAELVENISELGLEALEASESDENMADELFEQERGLAFAFTFAFPRPLPGLAFAFAFIIA